ncbi:uncharacterized protein LOC62_05G007443 [Vanrija pseudolonga]|uniref:Barwin domain-containing protein n=1 Tax=Vanrija pseudolonga TaxID=143232 RepID=A0AAF1BN02_9TREE|nr:hypothetical protein LOC62_05G007443 [Vanrija pseudolonga]
MLAKTLALFAIAASLAVAAPMPDWNGNGGHKHHGHGGHRHGGWRSSSEVATPTDNGDNSDASPTPAAAAPSDNSDNSDNSGSNAGSDSAANQSQDSGSAAPGQNLAAQPQSSNSGAQPSGETFTGDATFYDITNPAENEGNSAGSVACSSQKYSNSDAIIAINSAQFPGSCGKTVIIKDTTTGNTATATAVDECTSCGKNGIDLTPSLWQQLHNGHTEDGIFTATWSFQ